MNHQDKKDGVGFTPGPWSSDEYTLPTDPYFNVYAGSGDTLRVVCRTSENGNSRAKQDARLIAAAPELYAALERTLDWLASYPGGGALGKTGPYEQARSALYCARGEAKGDGDG